MLTAVSWHKTEVVNKVHLGSLGMEMRLPEMKSYASRRGLYMLPTSVIFGEYQRDLLYYTSFKTDTPSLSKAKEAMILESLSIYGMLQY